MDEENKGKKTDETPQKETEAPLTVEELKEALKECAAQKAEYLEGWQRARADFQNYKKEEAARMEAIVSFSSGIFVLKLLPILDNFELAKKAIPDDLMENIHIKGLMLIQSQLADFIKDIGITEIAALNQTFNPLFHEVVAEEDKAGASSGVIIEEVQKGYLLNGKVIRPAKVKLAK